MATEPDPYRTLGLPRTASLAEVRAAYRRLAKANHPDAAGEAALPRFLAIQAAYERLVGPTPGRPISTSGASPAPAARPRQPWEADPDRSDATRRAYGGRARRAAGTNPGKSKGGKRPGAPGAGAAGTSGASGAGGEAPGAAGRGSTKDPKKATLGSTSYDEADREAFEPDWVGASWYGTTSGTYWTINPKEYADPRKHGPEYQARARRASQAGKDVPPDPAIGGDPSVAEATDAGAVSAAPEPDPTPRHTTSSWWDATAGPAMPGTDPGASAPPRAAPRPRTPPRQPRPAASMGTGRLSATDPSGNDSLSGMGRALTQGAPPSLGWRIARALIGWIPIALAIGWAAGEVSGCARYSVSCDAGIEPIVWASQALVFIALLALPVVAGWAVIAAIVSLAVAVPATLFVTATAGAAASTAGTGFLGVVLGLAWVIGMVGAAVMGRRRTLDSAGPVS